jgi:hypothetical protein
MGAAEQIFNAILETGKSATDGVKGELLYGTVVTVKPLSINVDQRDTLPEQFFFAGQMVSERIAAGDRVALLSFNRGQQYYITEVLVDDPDMCFGVYQNDGGFIVDRIGYRPAEYFWIGQHLRPQRMTFPHTNPVGGGREVGFPEFEPKPDSAIFQTYPPLTAGDKCLLFSMNKGKKYYVAERVG